MKLYLDPKAPTDDPRVRADLIRSINEHQAKSTWDKYIRETSKVRENYHIKKAISKAFLGVCWVAVIATWIWAIFH